MQQQQPKKLTAVQEQHLDKVQEQFIAMAHAGIDLINRYGVGELQKDESQTLAAMGAALFASYFSSQSSLTAKKTAIGVVLRAAFCYGQECGKMAVYNEESAAAMKAAEASAADDGEPGENDGDGAGAATGDG